MSASRNDSNVLGTYGPFANRVQPALIAACVAIANEGTAVANHPYRLSLVHAILSSPSNLTAWTTLFALSVSTDATVLADATQAGTVALTANNISTQVALVTDAHIDAAISSQFNAFCSQIPA